MVDISKDSRTHYHKKLTEIYLILETEPGERVMRPGFGCGLRRYLMKPNTSATRALIERDVETDSSILQKDMGKIITLFLKSLRNLIKEVYGQFMDMSKLYLCTKWI